MFNKETKLDDIARSEIKFFFGLLVFKFILYISIDIHKFVKVNFSNDFKRFENILIPYYTLCLCKQ